MTDFQIRSDNVDVEQIMRQIRARIREKRGVDYTEEEIRELANVRLEKFLDPRGVRSDLIEQFRRKREATLPPNFKFEDSTLFETHRGFLRFIRRLLNPILKLFFNPAPLIDALHIQAKLNAQQASMEPLYYEVIHNLVVEATRLGIEVKNLKMRLESMSSRLDFDERRARALEGVVQYRPGAVPPLQPPAGGGGGGGGGEAASQTQASQQERRSRRRRRRGRKPGDGSQRPGEAGTSSFASHEARRGSGELPPASAPGDSQRGFGEARSAFAPGDTQGGSGGAGTVSPRGEGEPVPTKPPTSAPGESQRGFGEAGSAFAPRDTQGGSGVAGGVSAGYSGSVTPKPHDDPRGEGE